MKNKILIAVLMIISVFAITACTTQTSQTGNAVKETGDVKEFNLESYTMVVDGKYYPQFNPHEIVVKKGDRVKLNIKVTSGIHDFKIDKFNVYTETPLNQTVTVEFVATETGEFVYYCTKPMHRQSGHLGILKVTE